LLKLVIGDKALSSWSLRPWILLKHLGIEFEEIRLPLDTAQFEREISRYSPSRRVPVLLDGPLRVWESIAICEYVNELAGGRAWPGDRTTRAEARAVSAEMHAGFQAMRNEWSMQATSRGLQVPLSGAGRADVARIDATWSDCRSRFQSAGPWLFGDYCAADAMFAPVLLRFYSYGAELSPTAQAYFDFALQDPHLQEWLSGAEYEVTVEGRPEKHA
jgi:glutathione S-transferase